MKIALTNPVLPLTKYFLDRKRSSLSLSTSSTTSSTSSRRNSACSSSDNRRSLEPSARSSSPAPSFSRYRSNSLSSTTTSASTSSPLPSPLEFMESNRVVPSSASTPLQSDKDKKESSVPTIRIVPHVGDHRGSCPFAIQERKVPNGEVIKVKRFVDKAPPEQSALSFRSKVVSRQHAEIWSEGSNFYIKDTKSSSGTFVNNVRISPAGLESKPVMLRDGDIVQLGVDYQGRTEDVFKCVRMRVELNRSPLSRTNNAFRRQVVKALKSLALASNSTSGDCCICLSKISPFQALFIAPCCHSFHYKCARPLLNSFPNFLCPLCRNFADLGASVSMESLSLLDAEDLDESDLNPDLDDAENINRGTVIASNGAEHENEQRSTEIMELDSEEFGASQEGIGGGTQVEEVNSGSYESQNGRRPFVGSNFNSPRNQTMFPGQYPDETL